MRNSVTEDVDEFGELVQSLRSQMHPIVTQRRAFADSDLEDGELLKMLASPGKLVAMIQERDQVQSVLKLL